MIRHGYGPSVRSGDYRPFGVRSVRECRPAVRAAADGAQGVDGHRGTRLRGMETGGGEGRMWGRIYIRGDSGTLGVTRGQEGWPGRRGCCVGAEV